MSLKDSKNDNTNSATTIIIENTDESNLEGKRKKKSLAGLKKGDSLGKFPSIPGEEKKEEKKEERKEERKEEKKEKKEDPKDKDKEEDPAKLEKKKDELKEKKVLKEEKKLDEKKELIKEEKKLEKKKEKEEKKREKEEEKRKEKEERQREKEEKKSAEQKRAAQKERRKSFLKQSDKGMNLESVDSVSNLPPEEKEGGSPNTWAKAKPTFNCPEVLQTQRELEQFLLNIPLKKLRGTTWTYYDIAPAAGYKETIIVLHSGGIRPEVMFEHILGFAQYFRVIAPWFPEYFNEIADYPAGLSLIMRHENIKKAHFFGIGFGAVVANFFLFKHPNRVITCSLVHSTLPLETKKKACDKVLKKQDFSYGPMHRILSGNNVKPKELEEHVPDLLPGEKELWLRTFKKFSATKQALTVRTEAMLDYHTNVIYRVGDFDRWEGKMFLVESQDDEYFDDENFQQLKCLFPNSYLHYLRGSGHLLELIRGQFVVDLVMKFINDDESLTNRTDLSKNEGTESLQSEDELKGTATNGHRTLSKDQKEIDPKETKEHKDKEHKEPKDHKEKEHKEKEHKDKEHKEPKEPKEPKDKEHKDKEHKEPKEHKEKEHKEKEHKDKDPKEKDKENNEKKEEIRESK